MSFVLSASQIKASLSGNTKNNVCILLDRDKKNLIKITAASHVYTNRGENSVKADLICAC